MNSPSPVRSASTMILLPRLTKQIVRRINAGALALDLRLVMALSYVRDHDGAPQQELVDALCIDAKNVVLVLNELEDSGYLIRQRDTQDRRRHRVRITPDGREALDNADRVLGEIEEDVLGALDADERTTLRELLGRALHGAEPAAAEDVCGSAALGDCS